MRRFKAGSAGIAVAALALTLAACGSDSGDSDSNTDNEGDSSSGRPQRRAHLVGHLRRHQRGARLRQADREVQRGVPGRHDQPRVGPLRPDPEQVQDRRRVRLGCARHPARRGRLDPGVRLAGLPLRPRRHRGAGEQLPRDPALQQRLRRQDLRRPAGHRHPRPDVQQGALREGRPGPRGPAHHVGRGHRGGQGAEEQGQASTASTSTPAATSCCPSCTARAPTSSTSTARPSPSTAPRRSPASRPPRTWSRTAPRSSRRPTTPTAR